MTTVLALGGCGAAGRYAVQTLLPDDRIDAVIVADLDGERAGVLAARLGPRVSARRVDVTDPGALRAAIDEADVVMNTVGPYFRFGVPILRATIEAGKRYADVCDDWQPTLDMLELDAAARERGVTAVIGMGITPGVSNLVAALALGDLDEPDQVITGWDLEAAMPEEIGETPSAATLHGVEQLTGTIRVRRAGRFVDEPPIRAIGFEYPGLGSCRAHTIGHPEPVTLPRAFPSLRESVNVMVASPSTIAGLRALRWLIDCRLLSPARAARWAELAGGPGGRTPSLRDLVARGERRGRVSLPPLFAVARGRRAGAPAAVAAMLLGAPAGGIGGTTGVPLGVCVRLLVAGAIPRTGVMAPEVALDPGTFLDALAPLCDPPRASRADMVLLTRSWQPVPLLEALRAVDGGAGAS